MNIDRPTFPRAFPCRTGRYWGNRNTRQLLYLPLSPETSSAEQEPAIRPRRFHKQTLFALLATVLFLGAGRDGAIADADDYRGPRFGSIVENPGATANRGTDEAARKERALETLRSRFLPADESESRTLDGPDTPLEYESNRVTQPTER